MNVRWNDRHRTGRTVFVRVLRWIVILALAAGLGAGAFWYLSRPPEVAVVGPARGDAAEIVYATAVVEPRDWAKVAPLVRERIVELCDCEGERVDKGAELARLDDREAHAALSELEARQRLAEDRARRLAVLAERNVTSRQELDRAESELAQIEALLAGQKARLENYVLRSPVEGVVLRQDGEVGEIAEPGTVLLWVGRPSPLILVADVNEEDIPRVAVGQKALVRADAFPTRNLAAEVYIITPKGDPVTKTYRVRLKLPDETPLMIGMTVEVNIVVGTSENALLVPSEAVDGGAVFVISGGTATRREVETGIRGTERTEILSGLAETDRIVSPYPEELADGDRVRLERE